MQILVVVCVVFLLVAVGFVAVYAVMALEQARRTLKSVEQLSEKMNHEVDKVQTVTNAAATVANAFSGTMGKSAALVFSLIRGFLKKRKEFSENSGEAVVEPAEKRKEI